MTVSDNETRPAASDWRIGYGRRADPDKADLHQFLRTQERPFDAFLVWNQERKTYQAVIERISVSPDEFADDIPY